MMNKSNNRLVYLFLLCFCSLEHLCAETTNSAAEETSDELAKIQLQNVIRLGNLGQSVRVIPHRVNSAGKLQEVFSAGLLSFEVDVIFRESATGSYFEVGHDDQSATGVELGELLEFVQTSPIQKIWLDAKNLDETNLSKLLNRLDILDQKFGLKEIAIFETSSESPMVIIISDAGYHVSYYLPTEKTIELLTSQALTGLAELAEKISEQISTQHASAISFDARLYPFVQNWLEERISTKIDYHTWDLSLALYDVDFIGQLQSRDYYNDTRIKTILVPFASKFHR